MKDYRAELKSPPTTNGNQQEDLAEYSQKITPFPFHLFPDVMRTMSSAQVMALVARAAYELNLNGCLSKVRGWTPQAFNLFIFIHGRSTTGKTANTEPAFADLFENQSDDFAKYYAALERTKRENKGKKPENREPEPERPPMRIVKNATVEALESPMQRGPVLYVPGEARTISHSYTNDGGENIDAILCEFWNGESYTSTRVTRGSTHIERTKIVVYTSCVSEDLQRLFVIRRNGGLLYRSLLIQAEGKPANDEVMRKLGVAISEAVHKTNWLKIDGLRLHPTFPFIKSLNGKEFHFLKFDQYAQRLTPVFATLYAACKECPAETADTLARLFMEWYEGNFHNVFDALDGTSKLIEHGVIHLKVETQQTENVVIWKQVMDKYELKSRSAGFRKMQQLEQEGILKKNKIGRYVWA